jgi:hypothetical protein
MQAFVGQEQRARQWTRQRKTAARKAADAPLQWLPVCASVQAPGRHAVDGGALPPACSRMGLGAGALEVGVFAAFAVRAVARHVGETIGGLLLSIHGGFSPAGQLTLPLLVFLEPFCGAGRPAWRLRKGHAWPPRLR